MGQTRGFALVNYKKLKKTEKRAAADSDAVLAMR
jgi:hypothetical protein